MELQGLSNPASQAALQASTALSSSARLAANCCDTGNCNCNSALATPASPSSTQVSLSAQGLQLGRAENSGQIRAATGVGLSSLLTPVEAETESAPASIAQENAPAQGRQAQLALQAYRQQANYFST